MDEFNLFWAAYPRKVAKAEARKAWLQTTRVRPPIDVILKSLEAACKTEQWARFGGLYIPHAATWLRGERWEDIHEIKLPDIVNEKPWHETSTGIEAKGKELGLTPDQFEHWQAFKIAVMRKAMKAA